MKSLGKNGHVLVVDDEAVIRNGISRALENRGILAKTASSGLEALDLLARQTFDLVLLDIRMEGMEGTEVLGRIRAQWPAVKVVMITGYPTIDTAVLCTRMGALDYLVKPFRMEDLDTVLARAEGGGENMETPLTVDGLYLDSRKHLIIGKSQPMKEIFEKIRRVAPTESTVLITGESGTGKELVARAIHSNSLRRDREFVAVDCSSLVETLLESELFGHVKGSFTGAHQTKHGLFELANHGTFFFDEVANLSLEIQAKLLRVIQEREFMKVGDQRKIKLDIRIISASNRNLEDAVRDRVFREDLYYRLSVVPIHLAPLRERREDVPLLVQHFLEKSCQKIGKPIPAVSSEAMDILQRYAWPGNVRELEHLVERVLILEDMNAIQPRHLPAFLFERLDEIQMFSEKPLTLEDLEKKYITFVLRRTGGNRSEAAHILGIHRKTLGMKIKKYGLS